MHQVRDSDSTLIHDALMRKPCLGAAVLPFVLCQGLSPKKGSVSAALFTLLF